MIISNSNNLLSRYRNGFSILKNKSFNGNNIINLKLLSKQNSTDKLELSDEAQIKMKADKLVEESKVQSTQTPKDPAVHTRIIEAESIVGAIIGVYKNQIESGLRDYYLSTTNIINSPLSECGNPDDYKDVDMSKELVSTSTNTLDRSKELTTVDVKNLQIDPTKKIVTTDDTADAAFDKLKNNMNSIIQETINRLNGLNKKDSFNSEFDQAFVDGIKDIEKNLTASLVEASSKGSQDKEEFAETMKKVLGDMNSTQINLNKYSRTQVNINNYSDSEIKKMSSEDLEYINKVTTNFDNRIAEYEKQSEYSTKLLNIVFSEI
jgi:hypothetical protein